MSYSFPHVGVSRRLGKYVAVFALVASGLTLGIAGTASATPTISEATGFPVTGESAGLTSLNITPQHVGDLVILSSQIHSQTITISSVASADTGTWTLAERYVDPVNSVITEEVWWAVATATTAATPVTVTYSASVAALSPELVADSYTTSQPSTWRVAPLRVPEPPLSPSRRSQAVPAVLRCTGATQNRAGRRALDRRLALSMRQ
jgi:hypothetical protein